MINMSVLSDKVAKLQAAIRNCFKRGYDKGKQSEYDTFWDSVQEKGNRTNYQYAFTSRSWNINTFKPKYPIAPSGDAKGTMMFRLFNSAKSTVSFKNLNVTLDLSGLTGRNEYMFYSADISELGILDISNMSDFSYSLSYSKLVTVEKLIISENVYLTYTFNYAQSLKNITFEGVIGQTIEMQYSPLTVESMKSAILHLKNYSGTSNESKYKIRFSSACWDTLEADSTSPTGTTWKEYVQNLGWLT